MHCPRLDHFVRINPSGSVSKCGHMINAPSFPDWETMQQSQWLSDVKQKFTQGRWPEECARCQQTETASGTSLRLNELRQDPVHTQCRHDYLIVSGVLDNICNSACQTCTPYLSTRIGSLRVGSEYPRYNNQEAFDRLPQERIIQLDINGGEPTASPNYKRLLDNLPPNVQQVRINTNGSMFMNRLGHLLAQGIRVIVTLSLDGVAATHDYVRWPTEWTTYQRTVELYQRLQATNQGLVLNFWCTVSALNIGDLDPVWHYSQQTGIPISYGILHTPTMLNIKYQNPLTLRARPKLQDSIWPELRALADITAQDQDNTQQLQAFVAHQDRLRGINHRDYLDLDLCA